MLETSPEICVHCAKIYKIQGYTFSGLADFQFVFRNSKIYVDFRPFLLKMFDSNNVRFTTENQNF